MDRSAAKSDGRATRRTADRFIRHLARAWNNSTRSLLTKRLRIIPALSLKNRLIYDFSQSAPRDRSTAKVVAAEYRVAITNRPPPSRPSRNTRSLYARLLIFLPRTFYVRTHAYTISCTLHRDTCGLYCTSVRIYERSRTVDFLRSVGSYDLLYWYLKVSVSHSSNVLRCIVRFYHSSSSPSLPKVP